MPSPILDPGDFDILVEAVKTRRKFSQAVAQSLEAVTHSGAETTERIFLEHGGRSAWAAYALTKRAARSQTGHVPGRGKRQRLVAQLELKTADERRQIATELATALEPYKSQIEHMVDNAVGKQQHLRRVTQAHGHQYSTAGTASETDTEPIVPSQSGNERRLAPRPGPAEPSLPQTFDMDNAASFFSNQCQFLGNASILECTRLFPAYLAGAIKRYPDSRNAGAFAAALSMSVPNRGSSGCLIKIEVISPKVPHIARELFGAHLEVENGRNYFYLSGGSRVLPDPRLILRDCRIDALRPLVGSTITDAILATRECQVDLNEGRNFTKCVTMVLFRAAAEGAEIYVLLGLEDAVKLRDQLYR